MARDVMVSELAEGITRVNLNDRTGTAADASGCYLSFGKQCIASQDIAAGYNSAVLKRPLELLYYQLEP